MSGSLECCYSLRRRLLIAIALFMSEGRSLYELVEKVVDEAFRDSWTMEAIFMAASYSWFVESIFVFIFVIELCRSSCNRFQLRFFDL